VRIRFALGLPAGLRVLGGFSPSSSSPESSSSLLFSSELSIGKGS
jgi:hypothetical protein